MTLTIDAVSKRYGVLPSEFMRRGNSFDLYVADLAHQFEAYLHKKAENKNTTPELSQEQMMSMMNRVRSQQHESKNRS